MPSPVLTIVVHKLSSSIASKSFFSLTLLTYGSHLILDYLTKGKPGIQLLWPFTEMQFQSSITFFPAARPSEQLLQNPNQLLIIVLVELGYALSLLTGVWLWKRRKRRKQTDD